MKKIITWSLVLVLCICLIPAFISVVKATPSTWYVATTGSDTTGDGTIGNPVRTIQHAVRYHAINPGDTVYIRQGNYNEYIKIFP